MKSQLLILFAIFLFACSICYADSSLLLKDDCQRSNPADTNDCLQAQLDAFENDLKKASDEVVRDIKSESGDEAINELKNRFLASQDAWKTYRDGFCARNHSSFDKVTSSATSMEIWSCKLEKTKARLKEIKASY